MIVLTVSDIFSRVYQQLRENGADPKHWDDDELMDYINDMLLDVAEKAQCFKVSAGIELSSGQRRYQVPSNILVPTRVEYDGQYLDACSVEDLDENDNKWRDRTGTPYVWFVELAPAGYIDLYRVPDADGDQTSFSSDYGVITAISDGSNTYSFSSDYGVITAVSSDGTEIFEKNSEYGVTTGWFSNNDNLVVHGYGYPDTLGSKNDILPRPIHGNYQIAVSYLTYRCFLKDGKGQDLEKAQIFFQQYTQQLNAIRTRPRTATRRRFVKRMQDFEIVKRIGPAVPSTIE